jgi:hypothetical protein
MESNYEEGVALVVPSGARGFCQISSQSIQCRTSFGVMSVRRLPRDKSHNERDFTLIVIANPREYKD